jgi:hypothetical protein
MGLLDAVPPQAYQSWLRSLRVNTDSLTQTYSSGVLNFTPAATPTDICSLQANFEGRTIYLKRISISGIATAAGGLDIMLQRSANGGGGTSVQQSTAIHDSGDYTSTAGFYVFSANRTSGGNGVSSSRPIVRVGRLQLGTAAAPAPTLEWNFATRGSKGLALTSLVEWLVLNLNGQTLPAGTQLSIDIEWTEEKKRRLIMAGDSTTSNANFLFQYLRQQHGIVALNDLRNHGSNGFRLTDFLNNTNGVTWPLSASLGAMAEGYDAVEPRIVICYGINDVRQGATSQAQLQTLMDSTLTSIKSSLPEAEIILWGPNSLAADDPTSSGYLTTTGLFSGMTLAQAAQAATDILYNTYASFVGDSRVKAVVQKQDLAIFGRTVKTVAASGVMTDVLHPNARGQKLEGAQILPYLRAA